jgi:hypothetical protein
VWGKFAALPYTDEQGAERINQVKVQLGTTLQLI